MDREAVTEAVRLHMLRCPDHEMTIDGDDEWRCLTCEAEEAEDE